MGTIRNITPKSESKFSLKKKLSIAAALAAIAAATYFFYTPTGHRSVYGNKVSEYITTEAGRKAEVAWLVKKGFNAYVGYGVREYLVSNPAWVQDFVLKCRRAGIRDVGFVYGSESSVLNELDKYQKRCTNDSTKFSFVVSEIEQYQSDGNRPKFYTTLRVVSAWGLQNKVKRYVYQGWPNQADCDSIVKYSDRVYLHAYGKYHTSTDVGAWIYGYTKGRTAMFADSKKRMRGESGEDYNTTIIYSCENPDPTKTQFGAKYFLTKSVGELNGSFDTYYKLHAPASTKDNIQIGGWVLFVEDQFKKIQP
ncbi:MAG TPA: hypothetical protein PLI67_11370 [Niabella sp.]|nr:hypothetical protein [Niabella sp.]